jgi:MFS superfamily sulfate permease-like transporter
MISWHKEGRKIMTTVQSMMLSVCFGVVVGTLIAEVVLMMRFALEDHKEKKRKRKEKEESADKAE